MLLVLAVDAPLIALAGLAGGACQPFFSIFHRVKQSRARTVVMSPAPLSKTVTAMLPIYLFLASYVVLSRLLPRFIRYWRASRMLRRHRRVVVFSRYPTAGRTKTRLIGTLGASGAAGLQLLMVSSVKTLNVVCDSI